MLYPGHAEGLALHTRGVQKALRHTLNAEETSQRTPVTWEILRHTLAWERARIVPPVCRRPPAMHRVQGCLALEE